MKRGRIPEREDEYAMIKRIGSVWAGVNLGISVLVLVVMSWYVLPAHLESVCTDYSEDLGQKFPERAAAHYWYLKDWLARPFAGFSRYQTMVAAFDVVALSHLTCGLMNVATGKPEMREEFSPLLHELVRRALHETVSPYKTSPENVDTLGDSGLYLSHLNVILGCFRHVTGDTAYDGLHERITRHLAEKCLADGDFHIQSFEAPFKWPADQTVTLCSLYIYDRIHNSAYSHRPIDGWLEYMREKKTDPQTGLPCSSLSFFRYKDLPRGCANSWSILYMAQFAPEQAAGLYARHREHFSEAYLGLGGFREWPRGKSHRMDVDSGPVIFGIGVAATGIGIGPARLFNDATTYDRIMRTAGVFGLPNAFRSKRRYFLAPLLGEAIIFNGETAVRWFGDLPETAYPTETDPRWGAMIALLLSATYVLGVILRIRKQYRKIAAHMPRPAL